MLQDTHQAQTSSKQAPKRSNWYLLTGLLLGFILGLMYTIAINPATQLDTIPASLKDINKDGYRGIIAQVYAATGNLERAKLRLELLEDQDAVHTLGVQAQRTLADGNAEEARALALLAYVLQSENNPAFLPASTPTIQFIPTQTLPMPSATP